MILLDAYALVAFLVDEPAAGEVEELVRGGETGLTLVNLAETIDVSSRSHGLSDDDLRETIEPLVATRQLALITPTVEIAWRAARLRIAHYDRRERAVSLADCFLLASGQADDQIATADPSVAEIARREAMRVISLPSSTGERP